MNRTIPALALPPQPALAGGAPAVVEASVLASASATHHSHHWVLPSPDGPYALGVCRVCNETREFPNFFVGLTYSDHKGGAEFMAPIEPSGIARYIP